MSTIQITKDEVGSVIPVALPKNANTYGET